MFDEHNCKKVGKQTWGDERISENNQGKLCEPYREMEGRNLIYKIGINIHLCKIYICTHTRAYKDSFSVVMTRLVYSKVNESKPRMTECRN